MSINLHYCSYKMCCCNGRAKEAIKCTATRDNGNCYNKLRNVQYCLLSLQLQRELGDSKVSFTSFQRIRLARTCTY